MLGHLRAASEPTITERMISVRENRCPLHPGSAECEHAIRRALHRKLEAIREYVCLCGADELEPTAILDIIDADYLQD